jgi:hypothetical protein
MTTMPQQPNNKGVLQNTTMATWAGAIARALRVYGVDDQRLFADADIDHGLVNNPAQRIPVADMTRLWNQAVAESGDPAFGLAVAQQVNLTTFHALGVAAMASATVHEAGDLICRFASMISDGIAMQLDQQGDEFGLVLGMRPDYPRFADASVEAVMASIYLIARQLVPHAGATRITFQHPCQSDPTLYQRFFQCPVIFGASSDGIYTALDGLASAQLPSSSPQVAPRQCRIVRGLSVRAPEPDQRAGAGPDREGTGTGCGARVAGYCQHAGDERTQAAKAVTRGRHSVS